MAPNSAWRQKLRGLSFASLFQVALWARHGCAEGPEDRRPQYARVGGDIETVWQRPHGEAKGVFFIAHGCTHQATDIFDEEGKDGWRFEACSSSNFGRCLGLPEEVRLRQAARRRGYVVVAVSGTGRNRCWNSHADLERVGRAIRHVKSVEKVVPEAPVIAMGASSGGAFVGRLAAPLRSGGLPSLSCIIPQIMSVGGSPNRGVPALFVHMARDEHTTMEVNMDMGELKEQGFRTAEVLVEPTPVTVAFLEPCLDTETAGAAVEALRAANVIDAKGYLTIDSRARRWVRPVKKAIAGKSTDTLVADESCLAELMNVAWAQHEFTSASAEAMLDFCEGGGSRDVSDHKELL